MTQLGTTGEYGGTPHRPVEAGSSLGHISGHPSFEGFNAMINPFQPGFTTWVTAPLAMDRVVGYMGWDPGTIVDGVNFVIDEVDADRAQYLPLYSDDAVRTDPSKSDAGLLFFPGDRNAPLAIVLAGGGWRAQANIQEAFPLARLLHQEGYNVCILRYRIGVHDTDTRRADDPTGGRADAALRAREDLATAVDYLLAHAQQMAVPMDGYSIWGSSAGGNTALTFAGKGVFSATSEGLPDPAAILTAYPAGHFWESRISFPPLYVVAAADDDVAPIGPTDRIVSELEAQGTAVEYERVDRGGHGFGIGVGTEAEGWVGRAIAFWQAQIASAPG